MNTEFLPDIARRYGCGLADVRGRLAGLPAGQPPGAAGTAGQDGVHLNAWGNFLMARQIERHLVYRPDLPKADWQGLARTLPVGQGLAGEGRPPDPGVHGQPGGRPAGPDAARRGGRAAS